MFNFFDEWSKLIRLIIIRNCVISIKVLKDNEFIKGSTAKKENKYFGINVDNILKITKHINNNSNKFFSIKF